MSGDRNNTAQLRSCAAASLSVSQDIKNRKERTRMDFQFI